MTTTKLTKLLFATTLLAACGDDAANKTIDAPPAPVDAPPAPPTYVQVDQLGRPGINEALLISNAFLNGYNATAPSYAGVDSATLTAVVGEAKTTLKAVYLGTCLLDGALGLTPSTGLKPAGMQCAAVGPAIWTENSLTGVTLTAQTAAAAQTYADTVFGQFVPDVMRIDTSAPSAYLTLCGGSGPLLCGGRNLNDDVIDITYNYLIAGAAVSKGSYDQVHALVSDGVQFDTNGTAGDDNNVGSSITNPVGSTNPAQGHPAISTTAFPYSAAPF